MACGASVKDGGGRGERRWGGIFMGGMRMLNFVTTIEVRLCSWGGAFSFNEGHPLSQMDAAMHGAQ
jgi:hypothetical protein